MRPLDIIGSATSNMMRSKVRTLLTIIAVFIGAFTITLTLGLGSGISSYIDRQLGALGGEDVLIIQPKVEAPSTDGPREYDPTSNAATGGQAAFLTAMLDSKDIETIEKQPGLRDVKPLLLVTPSFIEGSSQKKYQLTAQQLVEGTNYDITSGSVPSSDPDIPEILLTADYVDKLGYESDSAAVGQTVQIGIMTPLNELRIVPAKVSGVQRVSILSQGGMTAGDALVQRLYDVQTEGLPSESTEKYMGAVARFDSSKGEESLSRLKSELEEKGFTALTVADQIGVIQTVINAITAVLVFFGAIALLAASFGIINTLYMSVQERTKEIGLMKAIGMSRFKVFLLFSIEAVLIGFWGSLLGVLAAIGVGQIVNQIASDSLLKDLPGFDLTNFPLLDVLSVMAVIMVIAFLAGTLPARRAAKQDPITALRYE